MFSELLNRRQQPHSNGHSRKHNQTKKDGTVDHITETKTETHLLYPPYCLRSMGSACGLCQLRELMQGLGLGKKEGTISWSSHSTSSHVSLQTHGESCSIVLWSSNWHAGALQGQPHWSDKSHPTATLGFACVLYEHWHAMNDYNWVKTKCAWTTRNFTNKNYAHNANR